MTPANRSMVAPLVPRRAVLVGDPPGAAALAVSSSLSPRSSKPASAPASSTATALKASFDELDAKINAAMKAYAIPVVAVAVWAGGQEYVRGYGVTNVDHPVPIDGDTVFRIGSTTKTFTRR
jgi:CubicO group peptidase (beta-lactamase class C family)